MKIIEILPFSSFIVIDGDGQAFLTSEMVRMDDGELKVSVDKIGSVIELINNFHPLSIVWLN